jgi:HK97 family phage portal protein
MPPVPSLITRVGTALSRPFRAVAKALPMGGGYVLPLGGGFIPGSWATNYWQQGYDPIHGGGSAVVYACIAAYAQTIAMCPGTHWNSTGDGGRERNKVSALSRILRKPNSYQSPSDFFSTMTSSLYGDHGEAFGLALRNNRFEISEIHLMDSRLSFVRVATTGDVFYSLSGNQIVERLFSSDPTALEMVPARDVLHVRMPNPSNPLKGLSPLEAAEAEIAASKAMMMQSLAYSANQGRPSGVIETPLDLNRDQVQEARARWNAQTQGVNAGGTPILTRGMKWTASVVNSRDAQLVEAAQLSDQRIATAYRIPLALLSLIGGQGPQGSTESLMQFWVSTGLGFAANHIEDAFGRLFGLAGVPDDYLELDLEALLRAAFKDRIEGLARGVQGGIFSPNEARAREDLPAMEFGEEPRVQQQVVPLSAWAAAPPVTPAPEAPPSSPPAPDTPSPEDGNQKGIADADEWSKLILDAADRHERQQHAA